MMKRGFLNNRRSELPTAMDEKSKAVVHSSSESDELFSLNHSPVNLDPTLISSSEQNLESSICRKLPSEIICEVLKRLPAKSLCGFKCVSKLWKSTISDHRFVTTYHRLSATCRREAVSVLLTVGVGKKCRRAIYALNPELTPDIVHQITPPMENLKFISESVHGLIMLDETYTFTICNPSTRSFVTLPPSIDSDTTLDGVLHDYINVTSFDYDSVTDQHKVLNTFSMGDDEGQFKMLHKIFVLGSSTGSWRTIEGYDDKLPRHESSVFIGGFIYYQACDSLRNMLKSEGPYFDEAIVEFDVHLETFRSIKLSKDAQDLHPRFSAVLHLEGSLVVIDYRNLIGKRNAIDIWTLEDRVKGKWAHKTVVFAPSDGTKYLEKGEVDHAGSLSSTGEIVFSRYSKKKPFHLFYVNLKTETVRKVEVGCLFLDYPFRPVTVTDHVENVLSLNC